MATQVEHTFGLHLRRLRSAAGLSQEDLGARAGLSTETIGALERGTRRAPYRETVRQLAHALNLTSAERAQLETLATHGRARSSKRNARPTPSPGNLPSSLTSFVGRASEIRDLHRLFAQHRLVTLTGAGGIGKTRLATEFATTVAGAYSDGAWIVELALIGPQESVSSRIVQTLGQQFSEVNSLATLVLRLKFCEMLIVLDNCESALPLARAAADALLKGCPNLRIIATSRERLSLSGECVLRVNGLSVPEHVESLTPDEAMAHAAVRLFTERARQNDYTFEVTTELAPAVARMCKRLDGIPLAIELAAARLSMLGMAGLDAQLSMALTSIESGFRDTPVRHQTLAATIEWSYRLLSEPERAVLRRLSVFAGGCSLDAAQTVCQTLDVDGLALAGILHSLYEKSLVDRNSGRFTLLQSIGEFSYLELSRQGELDATILRHAHYFAAFSERNEVNAFAFSAWLPAVRPDFDNLVVALSRMLMPGGDPLVAARIAGPARNYWVVTGRRSEATHLARRLLTLVDAREHPSIVGPLYHLGAIGLLGQERIEFLEHAIRLHTALRDDRALSILYGSVARNYALQRHFHKARTMLGWSWTFAARSGIEDLAAGPVFLNLGDLNNLEGRHEDARAAFTIALAAARKDDDQILIARITNSMAETEFALGNIEQALHIVEGLALGAPRTGDHLAYLCNVCAYRLALGQIAGAKAAARDIVARAFDHNPMMILLAFAHLATVAALSGNSVPAARLIGYVNERAKAIGYRREPTEEYCYRILEASLRAQLDETTLIGLQADGAQSSADVALAIALAL
jgi:predicted ATPase/DNA-binding XRE family transcriptional regulator